MLLSMTMTRERFQGREPGQRELAPVPLSEARADELLQKLGGRGAAPHAASRPAAESPAGYARAENIPGLELVFETDLIPARESAHASGAHR